MVERRARIYPIGDLHISLRTFDERRFKKYIQHIADDPAGIAILMGDVSDARSRDHKFFAPEMIHPRFQIDDLDILEDRAAEYATDLLAPLGDKLAGILRGNHHAKGFTHTLRRLYRMQTEHNPPDLGDRAMIRVNLQVRPGKADASYVVFAQHRTSGGRKPGSQINQQLDNMSSFIADLYLFAHSHKSTNYAPNTYQLSRKGAVKLLKKRRTLITANAWVADVADGSNSYSDEKGLPSTSDIVYYADLRLVHASRKTGEQVMTLPVTWDEHA